MSEGLSKCAQLYCTTVSELLLTHAVGGSPEDNDEHEKRRLADVARSRADQVQKHSPCPPRTGITLPLRL